MASFITRRGQLKWVALLGIAVLLPTVSLLWFMSQVVANERLVIRQKLLAFYQNKLAQAAAEAEARFTNQLASLDKLKPTGNPYFLFRQLVLEDDFQGMVLWDADGSIAYPHPADVVGNEASANSPLAGAWQCEFAERQYAEAAQLYDGFVNDANPRVAIVALVGKSRCLSRLGRIEEAIDSCQKAAFATPPADARPALRLTIENARLLLFSLLKQSSPSTAHSELFRRTAEALAGDLFNPSGDQALLPANQNLFLTRKLLETLRDAPMSGDAKARNEFATLASAEELSLAAAETQRPFDGPFDSLVQVESGKDPMFGIRHRTLPGTLLVLLSEPGIASALSAYRDALAGSDSAYRILDASGKVVAGTPQPEGEPFATAPLPAGFPGWKAELFLQGGEVLENAANRRIAVYIWTGVLVIVLILVAGGFATQAVGKQIRLNRMKNDFIATVSHELKTPLASMRVLVDTLLEGHVRDEAQAREYLRLAAKENERLSRMIDNFLTFSRMERNKKAFTMAEADPAAIAGDAVESVKTKFAARNCHLTVNVAEHLPEISADHDAMVTVLVNLLDNACKYTTDDKQVSLRVYSEPGFICFAVADNGMGLARRHIRKVFDSFYQVDSSLARKAEGCGLGLSIVKFIVEAHKGKITVESKPGKGSTFTARLPADTKNGE